MAQRLDSAGGVVSASAYDAYGQESSTAAQTDPWGFNGRWGYVTDRETGLCYCENRHYDPANGRWPTRDPIGFSGGANLYGYCQGGAVGGADPSGLNPLITAGVGAVAGGLIGGGLAWLRGGSAKDVLCAALEGAVSGGVAGLVLGSGMAGAISTGLGGGAIGGAAAGGTIGLLGGVAGQTAGQLAGCRKGYDDMEMMCDSALGAAGGALGGAAQGRGYGGFAGKYPNAGGVGMTLTKNGKRVAGADIHEWTQSGSRTTPRSPAPWWRWPHLHVPWAPKKHWPWQR